MQAVQTIDKPETAVIRPIERRDNAAVAAIVRQVLPEFGMQGEGCAESDPELDFMCETYDAPGCAFFVLEEAGRIIGCGGVAPLKGGDAAVCELQKMYLLPAARGRGFGHVIIAQCLQAARALGFSRCYLETFQTMNVAQSLYRKSGFTPLPGPMGSTGHYKCTHWYIKEL